MNMAISVILKFNMYDFEACPSGQKRPIGIFVFWCCLLNIRTVEKSTEYQKNWQCREISHLKKCLFYGY
jgi:hypothetical protein